MRGISGRCDRSGRARARDDAATITPPPGSDVVLKTDAIVAGVISFPMIPPA